MPAATNIVDLRQLLAERFPRAHAPAAPVVPSGQATGIPRLDALLGGGLPQGGITELVGSGPGSGSAQVLHALLRQVAVAGRFLALVDGADSFDVDAADPDALARLLWVRCTRADEALKAVDLLLRDRNIPMVVLDLKLNAAPELRRIPSSTWFRFSRLVEHHGTTLLVITPQSLVGAADLRVGMECRLDLEALAAGPASVIHRLEFQSLRATRRGSQGTRNHLCVLPVPARDEAGGGTGNTPVGGRMMERNVTARPDADFLENPPTLSPRMPS